MGWRVALRSGRVHKLCQRLRSSGSRYARHRSHIRQLRRARTIRHGPGRASGRANWCGDGPGRPRPTRGRHTRRPGGRVVCTGIDNPGSNVFPASRPVWQWGGTRYNFYLALRLTRRIVLATLLFTSRATCPLSGTLCVPDRGPQAWAHSHGATETAEVFTGDFAFSSHRSTWFHLAPCGYFNLLLLPRRVPVGLGLRHGHITFEWRIW